MKNLRKVLVLMLVLAMVVSTACTKKPASTPSTSDQTSVSDSASVSVEVEEKYDWDGKYISEEDFKAYICHDVDLLVESMVAQLTADQKTAVEAAAASGKTAIEKAHSVADTRAAYEAAFKAISECVPVFEGIASYQKESNAERTNVLGILEAYAVTNGITGISLFEDGGYVMYNPRITLGTENYIVGYGFGTLAEGAITADLEYETNADWKRYYHTSEASDPGTLNYLNDQGSQVGDLYPYIAASFFTNFMNETKDGYDWVPELAKEKPVAVNDDDNDGVASKWRFEVRTGEDGLKYTTASTIASRAAFNGRPVALEDYEYAFKLLLTQSNQLYRGSELANTRTGAIKGAKDFYNGTADGYKADLWENVGIKTYVENGKSYFEVEFTSEYSQFYTMYYIASSLYMPIPEEFIKLVTVKNYLGYNNKATETPVDNSLALGAYYLENYTKDQQIVFKKNPNYVYADTKYSIPGIHVKIFTAANEDPTANIKEFLAGHFDSSGIPQTMLDEYRNDPRTRTTTGSSNFKINMNALDAETWEYMFGEDGIITKTPKDEYWDVKPALGNSHFVKALSFSIDRLTFANARGSIPSVDYLASNYMSDPENGLAYSSTDAHKKAVECLLDGTDGYGYSLELARDYFRVALEELEAQGAYAPGTKENPTVIDLEIAWMRPTQEEQYHNELKNFLETAFNDESVCGGVYQLSVNFWVGNVWSDVYYNKMMVGQFDLGFGSISGNSLDPIGFVSVLSSDPDISGSFTLNWGSDTNSAVQYPIVYKGARWSFDALYNAVNSKAIVVAGQNKPTLSFNDLGLTKNADGTYTGVMEITPSLADKTELSNIVAVCCDYEGYKNQGLAYDEVEVATTFELKDGKYVVTYTVTAELATAYSHGVENALTGFDIYYDMVFDGDASEGNYYSIEANF